MSEQDKSEEIEYINKPISSQSDEKNKIQEITEQFQKTNIQDDPSEIQSPIQISELYQKSQQQINSSVNSSDIVQIDKRFLLPREIQVITMLSENSKFLKERYIEHCMDNIESIQEFVQTQKQNRKGKQSNFINNDDESGNLQSLTPDINLQTQVDFDKLNFQESNQENSTSSNKNNTQDYIQKLTMEDPDFQQKSVITQEILAKLQKSEAQASSKKVSFLEDALLICLIFQRFSYLQLQSQDQFAYIQKKFHYKRSYSAFRTRMQKLRSIYKELTVQNLQKILVILDEFPIKFLQEFSLITQDYLVFPSIR